MNDATPLYNSRVIKIWVEYLQKRHPDVDCDQILRDAGMTPQEVEDPGHWFTQAQTDRFHERVRERTGDALIARKTGRYLPFCQSARYMNQFVIGFLSPKFVYLRLSKVSSHLTRGAVVSTRQVARNTVEIVSVPASFVSEKPYQCENRTGMFEAIPQFFNGSPATVSHPECVHRGDDRCRYEISWKPSETATMRRARSLIALFGLMACFFSFFVLSFSHWLLAVLSYGVVTMGIGAIVSDKENRRLARALHAQSDQASTYMEEMNLQYNKALLIQEIGEATANILEQGELIAAVTQAMRKGLDFDRGLIMLANETRTRLCFAGGYGYDDALKEVVIGAEFKLGNPDSKGAFVKAFEKQEASLIEDIKAVAGDLSTRSRTFAGLIGTQSLICVPIVYKKRSLGVLAVDNVKSRRPLRQSDVSILSGIAAQIAVGLINTHAIQVVIESEKKYRELVENANSIILRRRPDGTITFFNEFAQRRFGYRADDIIGKNIFGILLPDTIAERKSLDALISELHETPDKHIVKETQTRLSTGESIWIAWTHRPILSADGSIHEILCIGTDITQLKHAQTEKKELVASLHRAQKMEALGTLAGGVAHDLNNVLAGVVSYPDLLMLQLPEDSPLRKPVATIKRSGEKAAAIVQDLLTLARRGVAVADIINLNDIVTDYLKSPEHTALKRWHPDVAFRVEIDHTLYNITGSTVHLSKTLMNLMSNAAEAMEAGGEVVVKTMNRYVDRPLRGYDEVEEGNYSALVVSDTGVGITAEDLDRIFEPFYTKKKMGRSGTGLGMAVVWGTVKDHNGYIDIDSRVGGGTTFTLFFPATRRELSAIQEDALRLESLRGDGQTILVIDDMKDQQEVARNVLECLGYVVATADSGEQALDYLRRHSADLLILDMIMDSGMDGLETFTRVRSIVPDQKAVIVSGFAETDKVRKVQALGAGVYVKKPYSVETIGLAIRNALSQR
ncbi:MAG: ATP-binding protein [Pseudomonadota bacterium]